jgi:AraC-like DNA-binding protein
MPYAERSVRGFNSAFIAVDRLALKSRPARFDDDGTVLPLARLIIRTFNRGQPRLSAIAGQLFDALSSWLEFQSGSAANPHVEALKELIHLHWSDPEFNLEHASQRIPLSPAHLRRTFAAELKLPPVRYLQEYRIAQARRLLAIGGYSIKEISQMCGFSDPYYFSRAFRKLEGKSPVHWKVHPPNT